METNLVNCVIAAPLARACNRARIRWGVFFTNDGVCTLNDGALAEAMSGASRAVACQESWNRFVPDRDCPVELGSQTDNSALIAEAEHILSL